MAIREYPRWVEVHPSYVIRTGDPPHVAVSVPEFPQVFVLRSGIVQVLVDSEADEERATSPKPQPSPPPKQVQKPK